jgi:hypothetical protein
VGPRGPVVAGGTLVVAAMCEPTPSWPSPWPSKRIAVSGRGRPKRPRTSRPIARLPEREKITVALQDHDGPMFAEIGEVLGVPEGRAAELRGKGHRRLAR